QYIDYIVGLLHGDFGKSLITRRSFKEELLSRFAASLELALCSMLVAIPLGLSLGYLGATRRGSSLDHISRLLGVASYSIPVFWLGVILQLIFGIWLGIFPVTGGAPPSIKFRVPRITGMVMLDSLLSGDIEAFLITVKHMVLPSLTLGFVISGVINKVTRNAMLEVLSEDYVIAAKARGIPDFRIKIKYGLRNALIPILTIAGLQFALLMGGAVLTESTFSYSGLGTYMRDAVLSRDYTVVQAAVTLYAIIVAFVNLVVDIIYALLDPRIRY
ncbi:MAG: ABC transporter permease, partial [Thermoprotei archaeon]